MLNSAMIIACPACTTRYVVPDSAIGIDGRTVRCAKCRHSWFQDGHGLDAAPPPPAPAAVTPAPAPAPAPAPIPAPAPAPRVAPEIQPPAATAPGIQPDALAALWAARDPHSAPDEAAPAPAPTPTSAAAPASAPAPVAADDDAPQDFAAVPDAGLPPVFERAGDEDDGLREAEGYSAARHGATSVDHDTAEPAWISDDHSQFAHEPPFRRRRNPARMWTVAAVAFALAAAGAIIAVQVFGLPSWVPASLAGQPFAAAKRDLVLEFPAARQDRRTLPNGTEYFGASGTVTNVGKETRTIPTILIVLRDGRERIVYSWEVTPPVRELAPGESITVNEAVTDVPRTAKFAEIGWKPD